MSGIGGLAGWQWIFVSPFPTLHMLAQYKTITTIDEFFYLRELDINYPITH